jgi:HPt (histidine-containing phosphotransfer) domain-containing protein
MPSSLDSTLQSLRGSYAKALPARIEHLRRLWRQQDAGELQREAHKLRGSGESYGFPEVSKLCAQLESAAELTDWTGIAQILLDLEGIIKTT